MQRFYQRNIWYLSKDLKKTTIVCETCPKIRSLQPQRLNSAKVLLVVANSENLLPPRLNVEKLPREAVGHLVLHPLSFLREIRVRGQKSQIAIFVIEMTQTQNVDE